MIASRTGRRVAQRILCDTQQHGGLFLATPSTSKSCNAQRYFHASFQNAASTSHLGPLRPSMPLMAKKRSSTRVKAALDDAEDLAGDEDEGTAFDVDSDYVETKTTPSTTTNIRPRETFEETRARCQSKLRGIQEEGPNTNIRLGKVEWNDMLHSARSYEDLQSILEIRKEWNRLTSLYPQAIRVLSGRQARSFLSKCQELNCPELALDVITARAMYGLNFGLDDHRMLQYALLNKVLTLKRNKAKLLQAQVGRPVVTESSNESAQIGNSENEEDVSDADRSKAAITESRAAQEMASKVKLSLLDQMMTVSAITKVFSPDASILDDYCILLAVRGLIDAFKLNATLPSDETFVKVELLPRIARLLDCLSPNSTSTQQQLNGDIQMHNAALACSSIAKFLGKNQEELNTNHPTISNNSVLDKLDTIMKQCKEETASSTKDTIASARASLLGNVQ